MLIKHRDVDIFFRSDGVRGQIYATGTVLCTRLGALRGWFGRCAQEKKIVLLSRIELI